MSDQIKKSNYFIQYLNQLQTSRFWVKVGSYSFYVGVMNENKTNFELCPTDGKGDNRIIYTDKKIKDGLRFLKSQSVSQIGGVFWGCCDPEAKTPQKKDQLFSRQLVVEIDDATKDEQLARYDYFKKISHTQPWLIFSGGKSIHGNWILDESTPVEKVIYLRRLLCILLDADPAVARPHQPFRCPDFYNNKGNGEGGLQEVIEVGVPVSYDMMELAIQVGFEDKGIAFPDKLDDLYWSEIERILKSDKANKTRKKDPITKEEKYKKLSTLLKEGYDAFIEKQKKQSKIRQARAERYKGSKDFQFKSDNDLEDFIVELLESIPPRQSGTGTYEDYRAIFTGIKNEIGFDRAVDLAYEHSPGTNWNQILGSSSGTFSLGSVIYYAKTWGHWQSKTRQNNNAKFKKDHKLSREGQLWIAEQVATGQINNAELNVGFGYSLKQFKKDLIDHEMSEFKINLINSFLNHQKGKSFVDTDVVWRLPDFFELELHVDEKSYLPSPQDCRDIDGTIHVPRIIIKKDAKQQRAKIINNLRALGWHHILDQSQTGSGKSHSVVLLDNVIYLDQNYKNPSIEKIKEFPFLPPRNHLGIWNVKGRLVSDPSQDEMDDSSNYQVSPPNCPGAPIFRILEKKGYNVEGSSAPCEKCPENYRCHLTFGDDAPLFKGQRQLGLKKIKANGQGRVHPSQIHAELITKNLKDQTGAWEEAGSYTSIISQLFNASDMKDVLFDLMDIDGIQGSTLKQIRWFLNQLITHDKEKGKILYKDHKRGNRFYGFNDAEIKSLIWNNKLLSITDEEYGLIKAHFQVKLDDLIPESGLPDLQDLTKEERQRVRAFFDADQHERTEKMKESLDKVPSYFFLKFLDVITGRDNSCTIKQDGNGDYYVSFNNENYKALAKAFKCNIYLNATAQVEQIKGFYGIDDNDSFVVISDDIQSLIKVGVIKVNTKGIKSYSWSDDALERLKIGIDKIKTQNPHKSVAVICPKKYADILGTKFYYGRDDRGSNELKDFDIIIFCGTPSLNIGAVQEEFKLIHEARGKFTFEEYYRHRIAENRLQGLGRHRGQWKRHCVTQYYFCDESEDLSYFHEYGVRYQEIDCSQIDIRCAQKGDRLRLAIYECLQSLIEQGDKSQINQSVIAERVGRSKQAISKTMKRFEGGWKSLKKNLLSLIDIYNEGVDYQPLLQDRLSDWLMNPDEDKIKVIAERYVTNGVESLIDIASKNNASMRSVIRLFLLLTPLHDEKLKEVAYLGFRTEKDILETTKC